MQDADGSLALKSRRCWCYREAEEKRQAIALEKQRAIEAREQELAAQRAQREAERQALRRLQKSFAVRVEGSVTIQKAPKVPYLTPPRQCVPANPYLYQCPQGSRNALHRCLWTGRPHEAVPIDKARQYATLFAVSLLSMFASSITVTMIAKLHYTNVPNSPLAKLSSPRRALASRPWTRLSQSPKAVSS